jgi:hypothetical protein
MAVTNCKVVNLSYLCNFIGSAEERKVMAKAAPNSLEIVQGFQKAAGSGDFSGARKLLHDNLSFRGPIDTFDAPEPYLESLKKLRRIVERVDMHKVFVDGDDVCLFV